MALFEEVADLLKEQLATREVGTNSILAQFGDHVFAFAGWSEDEVLMRWFFPVEADFSSTWRLAKTGETLARQTGALRASRGAQRNSAWHFRPDGKGLYLDHMFRGPAPTVFVSLAWMEKYVSHCAGAFLHQLYSDESFERLVKQRRAETDDDDRTEAALGDAVNKLMQESSEQEPAVETSR